MAVQDEAVLQRVLFQSPLPVHNRSAFILTVDPTFSIQEIKKLLHIQERFPTPLSQLELYIDGVELDDNRSLGSYQYLSHRSVIAVRGAEYSCVVQTVMQGSTSLNCCYVKWQPHTTVTELLRAVWRKWGVNLTKCRFQCNGIKLPIEECYKYTDVRLPWEATMRDLGLCDSTGDRIDGISFRRYRGDFSPVVIPLNLCASNTVLDVHRQVSEWASNTAIARRGGGRAMGWVDSVLAESFPVAAAKAEAALQDDSVWADDVFDPAEKWVYLYTPGMHEFEKLSTASRDLPYFSYHPVQEIETPEWVDIQLDYRVRHLSDLGVHPGSVLQLDFWDSFTEKWSSEIYFPEASESITVKSLKGHLVHIPVNPEETVEQVLARVWCATDF
eukprot:TRINITY_DN4276_c0_g1_i2.p1 TRINITY_DN4276_c0_g1~~TRINITY_DN4276_c0_g1_i2.p1  ORF type:complete len:386 (+),score=43.73 TRINITY_DN4276_c0_g1_i2:46-1203(+)